MKLLVWLSLLIALVVFVPGAVDALKCWHNGPIFNESTFNEEMCEDSDAACYTKYESRLDEITKEFKNFTSASCTSFTASESTLCPIDINGAVIKDGCGFRYFSKEQSCCCTTDTCNNPLKPFDKTPDVEKKTILCNRMGDPEKTSEVDHERHKEYCWNETNTCHTRFKAIGGKAHSRNNLYYLGCAPKSSCPVEKNEEGCWTDWQKAEVRCCCDTDSCNEGEQVAGKFLIKCTAIGDLKKRNVVNPKEARWTYCPYYENACHSRFSKDVGGLFYLGCASKSTCPKEKDANGCWTDQEKAEVHCCCDTDKCNDGNQTAGKQVSTMESTTIRISKTTISHRTASTPFQPFSTNEATVLSTSPGTEPFTNSPSTQSSTENNESVDNSGNTDGHDESTDEPDESVTSTETDKKVKLCYRGGEIGSQEAMNYSEATEEKCEAAEDFCYTMDNEDMICYTKYNKEEMITYTSCKNSDSCPTDDKGTAITAGCKKDVNGEKVCCCNTDLCNSLSPNSISSVSTASAFKNLSSTLVLLFAAAVGLVTGVFGSFAAAF